MKDSVKEWFANHYRTTPWKEITKGHRREIIKLRLDKPAVCPVCGGPDPCLFSTDGKFPDNDSNYYWSCRACKGKADHDKNRRPAHIHIKK